jgi:hypothetical protein
LFPVDADVSQGVRAGRVVQELLHEPEVSSALLVHVIRFLLAFGTCIAFILFPGFEGLVKKFPKRLDYPINPY